MEIREFLSLHSSRLNADILADKIEEDPWVFETVWGIMLEDASPLSMRAAWSLAIFAEKHPSFAEPRVPEIIRILPGIQSAGVKRCLLNMLSFLPVPADLSGILFDYCFGIMETGSVDISHKAYAMTILYNISEREPELKPEMLALFEAQLDDESPGIRSRSKRLLEKLMRDLSPGGK